MLLNILNDNKSKQKLLNILNDTKSKQKLPNILNVPNPNKSCLIF